MDSIKEKLDKARKDLLDLGARNPLINYRLLKAKGVEVVNESPPDVYKILVQDGKTMSFLPKEDDDPLFENDEAEDESARHTDNKLQTNHASTELQKRLLNTHHTARTSIQDQGITTLYLALGMLEWYEAEASEILRQAPLILLPVELSRASIRARFKVEYTGEEIGTNLSLQEKLKAEFGLQLPSFLEETDNDTSPDIKDYYQQVNKSIDGMHRWRVDTSAIVLGFFSFAKFLMYRDLDPEIWPEAEILEHPVLKGVLGTDGFREPNPAIGDGVDNIDEHLKPDDTHHVVDADSSQALAIHDVSQGRNLVIQGPPGTGKSQTITNLIAEGIAKGKRILFVAEKLAALEVVKRKLDSVGLGDACLELHSHKTNKKVVLAELKRTLDLAGTQVQKLGTEMEPLPENRSRLNNYCEAVNQPIGESGITAYEAFGRSLAAKRRLADVALPSLDLRQFGQSASDFTRGLNRTKELQTHLKRIGVPVEHPFWGSRCKDFLPSDRDILKKAAADARDQLLGLKSTAEQLAQHLNLPAPETCKAAADLGIVVRRVLEAPDLTGVAVDAAEWRTHQNELEIGLDAGERIHELRAKHEGTLIPEAWTHDVLTIRQALAAYRTKWWRAVSGKYRQARNELTGLCSQALPKSEEVHLRIVDAIMEVQREQPQFEKIETLGKTLFGTRWYGLSSEWAELRDILVYLSAVHESVARNELPEAAIIYLTANPDVAVLSPLIATLEEQQKGYSDALKEVIDKLQFDETHRFGNDNGLKLSPFTEQVAYLDTWESDAEKLQDIAHYNRAVERLRADGFTEIVEIADTWPGASEFLSDLLEYAWYSARGEEALLSQESLGDFSSDTHQYIVERFKALDLASLEHNKVKVASKHRKTLPQRTSSSGQLGLLTKEFEKKRKHLPIRQLMTHAGTAIQTIKPVYMMSPLSVAEFLPPGSVAFDWVVFDEASQVKPVDAYGAIIRGKQAVVVGDSRQLPPTNFFEKNIEADDEDDAEDLTADMESILRLFSAQRAPERMLRWHYRSRHESLITVSNIEFYDSRLQLFPSPDSAREEVGLVYHYLEDTAYDRSGTRTNPGEAEAVAAQVMAHARSRPDMTLGVATFSTSQMRAIQDQLELLRRQDPSCEHFFNEHPEEPFFVKNLENVQGDERDVIFISIGYGRDTHGRLTMNFGPLNREGGERRLNVLITRARQRCEIFTNLIADDIDINATNARGIVALKRYLRYAQTGEIEMPIATGKDADSPFETEVAEAVRRHGYEVDHQIGSAGYFIDLAVKDPQRPGRYLLGIECDGATYHSAQSARDRDRLRQQVLEGLGWRIHRIWSTDWFRTPEQELQKTIDAIEAAKVDIDTSPPPTAEKDSPSTDKSKEASEPISSPKTVDLSTNSKESEETPEPEVNDTTDTATAISEKYETAELMISTEGQDLHAVPPLMMADWITRVVEIESPVHFDEVAKRIANAVGVSRVGNRIRESVQTAATYATRGPNNVEIKGEFLYWTDQERMPIRDRSELPNASRKLKFIAPEEIEAAIKQSISDAIGIERSDLCREACKLFGFRSVSADMREGLETVINDIVERGDLVEKNNALQLR